MAHRLCPISTANPNSIAIAPSLSYGELNQIIERVAHGLHQKGYRPSDPIIISSITNVETICLIFAAWRLSLTVLLIPKHFQQLENFPSVLSTQRDARQELYPVSLLLPTSGSSGTPKWAAFPLNQLLESAKTVAAALAICPSDRYLLSLPLHHVGGLGVVLRAFCSGCSIVFEDKSQPYPSRILSAKSQFASLVPTQLYRLLQSDFSKIDTHFMIGGASLSQKLYEKAISKGLSLKITYGLTEMSSSVLLTSNPVWIDQVAYLGFPLENREMKLVNGEIFVRGSSLFSGYLHQKFEKPMDWFATKDLGKFHEKHGFAITGRKDFQFTCGGENISPEEIESVIQSIHPIEAVVVVPLFDEEYGARPVALMNSSQPPENLMKELSLRLPKFKVPIAIIDLPATEHLKPNRKQLTDLVNKNYHCKGFVRYTRTIS